MTLLSAEAIPDIEGKTIVLDTNAFVEGYECPTEFSSLIDELTHINCTFTTIEAVRLEFFSKNRSLQELEKKANFYQQIITYPELPPRTFEAQYREYSLIYAFGSQSQNFKAVDFMITAALKRYSGSAVLLTNDHHDFTTRLFDLKALLPLTPVKGPIVPFGLYSFSDNKYATLLSKA